MDDKMKAGASVGAMIAMAGAVGDRMKARGVYVFECHGPDGELKWTDTVRNTVVTVGKNLILDKSLDATSYTATEYMLLVGSGSYSAISAADTMASHAGWQEGGGSNAPTYSGNRKTCVWSAASAGAKALSASLSFSVTGTGTIKGAALVGGASASATKDDTGGTLISAGLFTGGDRAVLSGDTVSVSYSASV